jgi:hypothetical protein
MHRFWEHPAGWLWDRIWHDDIGVLVFPWLALFVPHFHRLGFPLVPAASWPSAWVVYVVAAGLLCENLRRFFEDLFTGSLWESETSRWAPATLLVLRLAAVVAVFAVVDLQAAHDSPHCFGGPGAPLHWQRLDAVYFALGTLTTTGFGDIVPRTEGCRGLLTAEMTAALLTLGLAFAGLAWRLFERASDKSAAPPAPTSETAAPSRDPES